MKLGPEKARAKLVEALRSGKYPQTDRALRDREGYCCLGVACDLYRKHERPDEQWKPINDRLVWEFLEETGELPIEVRNWLGFATCGGRLLGYQGKYKTLMCLNDEGKNFEYIADAIEDGAVELKETS